MNKLFLIPLILALVSGVIPYKAKVISVYDGDTCTVEINIGLDITKREKIRLYGINAPELTTEEGKKVAAYVKTLLEGKEVRIETNNDRREKYGRLLATVYIGTTNVNKLLIEKCMAKEYYGRNE